MGRQIQNRERSDRVALNTVNRADQTCGSQPDAIEPAKVICVRTHPAGVISTVEYIQRDPVAALPVLYFVDPRNDSAIKGNQSSVKWTHSKGVPVPNVVAAALRAGRPGS